MKIPLCKGRFILSPNNYPTLTRQTEDKPMG